MIKEYLAELLSKKLRENNRKLMEYRNIDLQTNVIKRANGSARVKLGNTDVIVGVKFAMGTPYPDSPEAGVLITTAELSPLASPNFETGPPRKEAIEFARVVDRAIRESKCIDFSKYCIEPKEKVWILFLDIYPINADGNLFDASVLAAVAALKNAKLPKYDKKEERVLYEELTNNKIELKQLPMLCTFGKIGSSLFLDPSLREESAFDCRLSIATLANGNICAMQKGGEAGFTEEEILSLTDEAIKQGKILRKLIK